MTTTTKTNKTYTIIRHGFYYAVLTSRGDGFVACRGCDKHCGLTLEQAEKLVAELKANQ